MQRIKYNWSEFDTDVNLLYKQVVESNFKPDIIMAVTRGGSCLGTALSYRLKIPIVYYSPQEIKDDLAIYINKLLIVDDINDTGKTIKDIKDNIREYEEYIGTNCDIKFLTIHNNTKSISTVDYFVHSIEDKEKQNIWLVYPWEYDTE